MATETACDVQLIAEIDELWHGLVRSAVRRGAAGETEKPLISALFRLCTADASPVEVAVVLRLLPRFRALLNAVELALLDRSMGFRGLQGRMAAVLGISRSAVSKRRERAEQDSSGRRAGKHSPKRPRLSRDQLQFAAEAIVARHERELEQNWSGRYNRTIPDPEDHWGLAVHVWHTAPLVSRETAAEDLVDCLRLVVHLHHQIDGLEEKWLGLGRHLGISNAILGESTGRRSRNAVWNARRRLRNGAALDGRYNLARLATPPAPEQRVPSDTEPSDLDREVRAVAAALLECRDQVCGFDDIDGWMTDLATAFASDNEDRPLPESSVALLMFMVWDLSQTLQEHADCAALQLHAVLRVGMELRRRVHAQRAGATTEPSGP